MANQVDYRDPTPNKFPDDYDQNKVDPRVKLRSDSIKHKQKGKHTREAMYQALEIGSVTANEAKETAVDTASRQDESEKKVQDTSDNVNNVLAEITKNSGDTAAPEVIGARKPKSKDSYATLGERLNAMPMNSDLDLLIGDSPQDVDGGIPEYMNQALNEASELIDLSLFNLGFGTDYHYETETDYSTYAVPESYTSFDKVRIFSEGLRKSLNLLSLTGKLDAVVFNGDNADRSPINDLTKVRKQMIKTQNDFANTVFSATECPAFILKGNHDNGYNTPKSSDMRFENVIHDADFGEIYRQNSPIFGEHRLNGSNYYYKDFEDKKVRLIGLDTADLPETEINGVLSFNRFQQSGFRQEQINWLANDALQIPKGFTVLITTHWPINHTFFDYPGSGEFNHQIVKQILEDFVTGCDTKTITTMDKIPATVTYSFASAGNLAAVLTGHRHLDQQAKINGVNYISTRCSLTSGDNQIKEARILMDNTSSEDAFDIVSVDVNSRTIKLRRVGAGSEDPAFANRSAKY